jgi:predicted nucleic acid-binding protein
MTWDWCGTDVTSFTIVMNRFSFDTNILIYSIDLRFPEKHAVAEQVIRRCGKASSVVALQCLSEFYRATTRKQILPSSLAFDVVQETRAAFEVAEPSEADLVLAMQYHRLHKLQFFDSLLWATLERNECTVFFTEDFQDGQTLGSVTFRNPFSPEFDLDAIS